MSTTTSALQALVNRRIQRLGKSGYRLDPALTTVELLGCVADRTICLMRGLMLRRRFASCGSALFVGRRVRIRSPRRIRCGRALTLEDGVEINALSRSGVVLGDNVTVKRNSIIECTGVLRDLGEGLVVGSNVGITQNCFIQVRGPVRIGSNVMFGPGSMVLSENHGRQRTDIPMIEQPTTRNGVTIEDDVWIGAGARILDGVRVGSGGIVAAGAVVTGDVEPGSIVAGVPARTIQRRCVAP